MANICTVCSKALKGKNLTFEEKKFCCEKCCDKFKAGKKKNLCEFC